MLLRSPQLFFSVATIVASSACAADMVRTEQEATPRDTAKQITGDAKTRETNQ